MSDRSDTNGASGSTPRAETVDAINAIWNQALKTGEAIPAEGAIAIASGLLYVGDQLGRLVNETRWKHEHDPGDEAHRKLGQLDTGSLAGLFQRTEPREGER